MVLSLMMTGVTKSQERDFYWWNEIHNWDGITNWEDYIIKSPGFMGPNALPVPQVKNGNIVYDFEVQIATDIHFSKGDQTQNLFLHIDYPLVKEVVSLEFYVVPLEHYKMDITTRDYRYSRDFDGKGFAGGDIYFGTQIQIVKNNEKWPDIALGLNCRTASGTNLEGARFTEGPGYFFDLSFGKNMNQKWNFYGMAGFYVWQANYNTGHVTYHQNDAFLFGLGTGYSFKSLTINNSFAGYLGYIGNDDKPIVYRLDLKKELGKIDVHAGYQYGINIVKYHMFRVSVFFRFEKGIVEFPL